jgi:hypothetical protein
MAISSRTWHRLATVMARRLTPPDTISGPRRPACDANRSSRAVRPSQSPSL